jgi:hypothetical protein
MTDYNYTASYSSSEISEVVIDNIVGIGAVVFSFVSLVALVLLWRWLKGHKAF